MRGAGWTVLLTMLLLASGGRVASAMAGSCKERASSAAEFGPPNRLTFEQCKARNQERDGDNVFDKAGLVWWDVRG